MSSSERAVLQAEHLQLIRGRHEIFQIDQLILNRGEVLALVGPNGAGKSSLLLTLALLHRPTQGEIQVNGVAATPRNLLALRRQMAVVFQESLLMDTTVLKNVTAGLRIRGFAAKDAEARGEEWLERLGIVHLASRSALHLSGGEAQRVNLARAFALEPNMLFMDEAFSALDYPSRLDLLEEIGGILRETRIATLFVTHDYTEIPRLADRVAVMHGGRLVRHGRVREVLGNIVVPQRIPSPWETA